MTERKLTKRDKQARTRIQMIKKAFVWFGRPIKDNKSNYWTHEHEFDHPFRFSNGFTALDIEQTLKILTEGLLDQLDTYTLPKLFGEDLDFSKQLVIHYLKKFEELGYFFSVKEKNSSTGKIITIYYLHHWWSTIKLFWKDQEPYRDSVDWNADILGIVDPADYPEYSDSFLTQYKEDTLAQSKRDFPYLFS